MTSRRYCGVMMMRRRLVVGIDTTQYPEIIVKFGMRSGDNNLNSVILADGS